MSTSRLPISDPDGSQGREADGWSGLAALAGDYGRDSALALTLTEKARAAIGASGAALYVEHDGVLELSHACGDGDFPRTLAGSPPKTLARLDLAGGCLLFHGLTQPGSAISPQSLGGALGALLALAVRNARLQKQIKKQRFAAMHRNVEQQALYDVGLAITSTLDMEKTSESILVWALSLLDARRSALYLLEGDRYRLIKALGGDARPFFDRDGAALNGGEADGGALNGAEADRSQTDRSQTDRSPADRSPADRSAADRSPADRSPADTVERDAQSVPDDVLPGARHLLASRIEIESSPRGFLVVADKESRRGVGPFGDADRATLELFASQAAIALENARLHRRALQEERMRGEMELAAETQSKLLPKAVPEIAGYELAGWNRPAREVGGDYYNLFRQQDGRLVLTLGDVTGKGMPAALMVSTLHSALRLMLDRYEVDAELFAALNRHIHESSPANKFITLLVAQLAPESGEMRYVNAGHNPAVLLRADGEIVHLSSGGTPIGLLPGVSYRGDRVMLAAGDLLCVYSDGITECAAPNGEEFEMERLEALLREHRTAPLYEIIAAIDAATVRFAAGQPQGDDQTVVLLRRSPQSQ
jgi:sigma-B regulation protein RsbU (phosphoserine phosphatase)